MSYVRKTVDRWDIEGNYGQGFERVTTETTRADMRRTLREYRENEPGVLFHVVKRRERIVAP